MPDASPLPNRADVLILGGGITGISLARLLARNEKSTILIEKRDFTSGTSQASGMMIWGGLLYLKNLEFRTVAKFCRSRDRLIQRRPTQIAPRGFTYLVARNGGRSSLLMGSALQLYRAFSGWKRSPVRRFPIAELPGIFDRKNFASGWTYEEGFLSQSDSHFGLRGLIDPSGPLTARNYHEVESLRRLENGRYDVIVRSTLDDATHRFEIGKIVNCGGVWADEINVRFGIRTRHRHHFSKGIYLLLGTSDGEAFVMDTGTDGDVICWVPWGEVTMWGPTETTIASLDDAHATAADVDWLLDQLNRRSTRTWTRANIANVRCGVRPLAVMPETKIANPLDLSRKAVVESSPEQPWWTVFGGKLSGAEDVAAEIYQAVIGTAPQHLEFSESTTPPPTTRDYFNGREIPDPEFCRDHEFCRTLADFLRRRTNIAQWIPRGGLGKHDEFSADILEIANRLLGDAAAAERALHHYRETVTLEQSHWHD